MKYWANSISGKISSPDMKQIPGIEKQALVASGDLSPKNSEGSAITLKDGGASWHPPKAIETDPDYEWAYPGILFHKDHALLHYFRCHREKRGQREMILARVPVEWFTE